MNHQEIGWKVKLDDAGTMNLPLTHGDRIYTKIVSRLAVTDFYTSEELKLMGETYRTLYLRYCEGAREIGTDEIRNSPGYVLWLSSEPNSSQLNVLRLANTNGEDNNKLHISSTIP